MSLTLQAVIVDWAGTVIDFGCRAPVLAMARALGQFGLAAEEALIRRDMGRSKRDHLDRLLREPTLRADFVAGYGRVPDGEDLDALFAAFETAMVSVVADTSDLVPGAADLSHALCAAGVPLGSTSGYGRSVMARLRPLAAAQGFTPDIVLCADDVAQGRPAPFQIWRALEGMGRWPAKAAIVVDDTGIGIAAGRNAGAWTVAVVASGAAVGLDRNTWLAMPARDRAAAIERVCAGFIAAPVSHRPHVLIETIADFWLVLPEMTAWIAQGRDPHAVQVIHNRAAPPS